jgi:hypothetical protein
VGGVDYGTGETGIVDDRLYVASNLATIAGLSCGEVRQAGDVSLCAVGARKFWTEGDRLFVEPVIVPGSDDTGPRPAPELTPAKLAFLNYDLSLVSNPDGSTAMFGSLHPAIRLKENAFDIDATLYQRLAGTSRQAQPGTKIALGAFAYRREWFEKRLRLLAGRAQSPTHGIGGGEAFDGISLERFNADGVGSTRTAGVRPITGFAVGAGVLQYRVGDKVYKQIPVREGKYAIDSEFLNEVPRGGRLEFVGLDGLPHEVAMPSTLSTAFAFYRPGDYSFDVQLGRLNTTGGGRPYASFGGNYGLARDIALELGIGTTDRAVSLTGTVNWRMPGPLGVLRAAGATARNWNGTGAQGASLEANYSNHFGRFSVDLSHRRNFSGGYSGLSQMQARLPTSDLIDSSRAAVSFSIPIPGDDISVRMLAERSRSASANQDSQAVQLDLGRSFGRLGSAYLLGRMGRDQSGKAYTSIMANWTVPLGRRNGATLNYAANKSEGQATDNRYSGTFWGSSSGAYGLGGDYQLSVDQDLRIAADGNFRSGVGTFSGSLSRQRGERPFGSVAMRGALVFAQGDLAATRTIANSLLVLRAKELRGSNIFVPPDLEGRSRFDGSGTGVLTDLAAYREFNLSFDQSGLPLGAEITKTGLSGSVRPYRGYVVNIPVRQLRPVRVYPAIPQDAYARGNAFAGDSFAPIEVDGSVYFNSWPERGVPVVLNWLNETGAHRCAIDFPAAPERPSGGGGFEITVLRDLPCIPKENT